MDFRFSDFLFDSKSSTVDYNMNYASLKNEIPNQVSQITQQANMPTLTL